MRRTPYEEMGWMELNWHRPFEFEAVMNVMTHMAAHSPATPVVLEVRSYQSKVRYYLGVDRVHIRKIARVFAAHGDIQFGKVFKGTRISVSEARQLIIRRPTLALNTEMQEAVARASLAAMAQVKGNEQIVLQLVIGHAFNPTHVAPNIPDPSANWLQVAFGNVDPASSDVRNQVKEKLCGHSFDVHIRIGATGTRSSAPAHILSLLSALRTLTSAGVTINASNEKPEKLDRAHIPWHFTNRLSVKELAILTLLPSGEDELPGVQGLHPRQLLPPAWYQNPRKNDDRTFALSLDKKHKLSISPEDAKLQTHVMGPIGSGKSTVLLNTILSDIYLNKSVLVIDPKADLVNDILARIPKHRENDVVVIDPSAGSPVGFNPLALSKGYDPNLVADAILAVFQEVFKENWGIRSQDVLSHALLTLAKIEGSSLLWLPTMLTDKEFRKKITAGINDKIGLEAFWTAFENMKDSEQRQEILPVLNKLRQFLLRPGLRNVLGQSSPKFNLTELFDPKRPRIVLVPLNKGLIGSESAKLLGSMLVSLAWVLTLNRAKLPSNQRPLITIAIDELQDYLALQTDIADALSMSRGLGVGFLLAHQYLEQLPPLVRAGIAANCRNKIIFGLSSADAKDIAAMAPELKPEDFMALPRFTAYTTINQGGRNTGWISCATLPMSRALRNPSELKAKIAAQYGMSGEAVEKEYMDLLEKCKGCSSETG
ncbi:MAG: type IV secretion system DNA-binding domain-containing protein, partial [Oscillospiraceae bacterium]|nr:type IV secretion system DNA-binding domain-containing protein [Oscillospiraceae bacterium]